MGNDDLKARYDKSYLKLPHNCVLLVTLKQFQSNFRIILKQFRNIKAIS